MAELPFLDESTATSAAVPYAGFATIPAQAPAPYSGSADANSFQLLAQKGAPNGYAPLDGNAKVPLVNLPDQASLDAEVSSAIAVHNALTSAHGISNTANLVYTNDPRLSDARTPTAHSHAISDVTGLQSALDGKQASGSYEVTANKNTANGYAGLGADGKIALNQLPDANALESEAIAFAIALG